MKKLELVPDWKKAWKFASIQISTVGAVLMVLWEIVNQTWLAIPSELQANIPNSQHIALSLFVLGIFGRILKLKGADENDE
jgi:hypothetical protein